jgi:hypothetical protein
MLNNMQRDEDFGLEVFKVPDIPSAVMYWYE